jgi:hypothetical protein
VLQDAENNQKGRKDLGRRLELAEEKVCTTSDSFAVVCFDGDNCCCSVYYSLWRQCESAKQPLWH